ncbi:hypothetical protein [Kribbella sp. NPDC051718]|uniref:hypothetical protein n=1 Tax=Kribbella sp. NPDC051718 TaxID=3155168 RepID=UPI0034232C5D
MTLSRFARRIAAAGTGLLLAGTTFVTVGASTASAAGHGAGFYGVWGDGVAVRTGGEQCSLYPGPFNCSNIVDYVNNWSVVRIFCQVSTGTVVGGNPYWVWVETPNNIRGYMSSYYIENATNSIDGLEEC